MPAYHGRLLHLTRTHFGDGSLPVAADAVVADHRPGRPVSDAEDGPQAGRPQGWALLLTDPASLPAVDQSFLSGSTLQTVHVVGGVAAVSDAVMQQIATQLATGHGGYARWYGRAR